MISPAQRAIAILIDLAEQGEIDPWNVQVVEVIDRFLAEIQFNPVMPETGGDSFAYEANLSESGQAFLYASMLVLLKADTLARVEFTELEPDPEEGLDNSDRAEGFPDNVIPLPRNLERRLRRRAVANPPLQRPVSLRELIEQLELMAEMLDTPPHRPKPRRPKPASEKQATQAINQLSHHENPAALANPMGEFIESQWLRLSGGKDWLDFEDLVNAWGDQGGKGNGNSNAEGGDRVGVFWALLLLSAQSKVELEQEALYQPLKIRLLSQSAQVLQVLPTPAVS